MKSEDWSHAIFPCCRKHHEGTRSSRLLISFRPLLSTDIDECATSPCHNHALCQNTAGSYQCTCASGFHGDGQSCQDIDECKKDPCDSDALCANSVGSFKCECKSGFRRNADRCEDVDECRETPCDPAAVCSNFAGSYGCRCKSGFHGNGEWCKDVDECRSGTSRCHRKATCTNTVGSHSCHCKPGYHGDGVRVCKCKSFTTNKYIDRIVRPSREIICKPLWRARTETTRELYMHPGPIQ